MTNPLSHDAHYWQWLFFTGRSEEYIDLEKRACWARHTSAVQQRLIKHGYAPAFATLAIGV